MLKIRIFQLMFQRYAILQVRGVFLKPEWLSCSFYGKNSSNITSG